jgi:phasin family protein
MIESETQMATQPPVKTVKMPAPPKVAPVPVKRIIAETLKTTAPKTIAAAKPAAPTKGTKPMTDTMKKVEETATKFTAEVTEKAQTYFADMSEKAKAAFEKSNVSMKEVAEFSKGNLEAVVESAKIAAKGAQTSAQTTSEFARKNFEATTAMFKTAAAVKSPTEFFKIQSDFAKSQFEGAVAEMSKSSEFGLKLMGEMFQPLSNRYAVAVEKVKSLAA